MLTPWYKRWWGVLIISILFIIIILAAMFGLLTLSVYKKIQNGTFDSAALFGTSVTDETVNAILKDENKIEVSADDDPTFGNTINPSVTIIAFEDFQCPFCEEAFPTVQHIIRKYAADVKFVYRDFPLATVHPQALSAAEAGECAHEQGKFWEMHDVIFANQAQLTDDVVLYDFAQSAGLDMNQFRDCFDDKKYESEVKQDLVAGIEAGVSGTPTFFINGVRVPGAIPLDIFEKIIESEIAKAKGQ